MADEDLLLKLPGSPEKPSPGIRRANVLSGAALVVSILSSLFVGSQWWEAHQTRKLVQKAQGPYIEIVKEEFVNQSSLMMTIHNIGHTTALDIRSNGDAYIGDALSAGAEFIKAPEMVVGAFLPNLPVGHDGQAAAYVPTEMMLKQSNMTYNAYTTMELRGSISYKDDEGNLYLTHYCYQVHLPYGPSLPTPSRCFHIAEKALDGLGPFK